VSKQAVVGIDFGGTNIKFGILDSNGEILFRTRRETEAEQGRGVVMKKIFSGIEECLEKAECIIRGIGIGSPGPLDVLTGVIIHTPNLPGWENVPIKKMIEEKFNLPAFLENDANAAARGESWIGAGRNVDTMLQLTLGTGIGGGIILNKKIWHGFQSCAGELGHVIIDHQGRACSCGGSGCIEAYASARGIIETFEELIAGGGQSTLTQKCETENIELTPKLISEAAAEGDRVSVETIEKTGRYLGAAISTMVHAFNPQMVVLSGGIAQIGEIFYEPIRKEVAERVMYPMAEELEIVPSIFEDDAGIIGAARCLIDFLEECY